MEIDPQRHWGDWDGYGTYKPRVNASASAHPYEGSNDYETIPHFGNSIPYRDKAQESNEDLLKELKWLKKRQKKLQRKLEKRIEDE